VEPVAIDANGGQALCAGWPAVASARRTRQGRLVDIVDAGISRSQRISHARARRTGVRRLSAISVGCLAGTIALGVAHDALPYLVALPRPDDELLELVARGFAGGILPVFAERGLTFGMLPHHRRLTTAADARAFALDPLTPPDLAELLRG
jgi:hypothetical protein